MSYLSYAENDSNNTMKSLGPFYIYIYSHILVKGINIFLKKEKAKNKNMIGNDINISQRVKNKTYLSIEKN